MKCREVVRILAGGTRAGVWSVYNLAFRPQCRDGEVHT